MPIPTRPVAEILNDHVDELMAIPGVVGLGEGVRDGTPCIKAYVTSEAAALELPDELEGVPVVAANSGQPKAGL